MYSPQDPVDALREICPACEVETAHPLGTFKKFLYLPEVLPVHIDYCRPGSIDGSQIPDLDGWVDIQQTLDLSKLCNRPEDKASSKYILQAVILYSGFSLEEEGDGKKKGGAQTRGGTKNERRPTTMGHFISYVRRGADDNWFLLDDNIQQLSPNRRTRRNGEPLTKQVGFEEINQRIGPSEGFQPRLLFYIKDREQRDLIGPPIRAPGTPDNNEQQAVEADLAAAIRAEALRAEAAQRAAAQQAAAQRAATARGVRDREAIARMSGERTNRQRAAATHHNKRVNVRFNATRYRGATQGAAPQAQGRCNCGGPRAQAGRGGHHQGTSSGGDTGGQSSGGGNRGRAAMSGSRGKKVPTRTGLRSQGPPPPPRDDDNNDDGQDDDRGDNQDDGSDLQPPVPWTPPGTPAPAELADCASWDDDHFKREWRSVFGKGPTRGVDRRVLAARLQEHYRPTGPRDWTTFAEPLLRQEVDSRRLEPQMRRAAHFAVALTDDDARLRRARVDLVREERLRVQRQEAEEENEEAETENEEAEADSGEERDDEEVADDELVDGIANLERLIQTLEEKACGCPLNGQAELPVEGVRNGQGTPHRALRLTVNVPRPAEDPVQEPHRQEWWIPLADDLGNMQNMVLSARVYVSNPNNGQRRIRIDLSGPEEDNPDPTVSPGSGRTTLPDFMNWVEFDIDFDAQAQQIDVQASQEDMPVVPFTASRPIPRRRGDGGGGNDDGGNDDGGNDDGGNKGKKGTQGDQGNDNREGEQSRGPSTTVPSGSQAHSGGEENEETHNDHTAEGTTGQTENQGNQTGGSRPQNLPKSTNTTDVPATTGPATAGITTAGGPIVPATTPHTVPGELSDDGSNGETDSPWTTLFGGTSTTSGGQKRTASVAGIDEGGDSQGGDSSRPKVGEESQQGAVLSSSPFDNSFASSLSFNLGVTDVSTPQKKMATALEQFPSESDEQRRYISDQLQLLSSGQRPQVGEQSQQGASSSFPSSGLESSEVSRATMSAEETSELPSHGNESSQLGSPGSGQRPHPNDTDLMLDTSTFTRDQREGIEEFLATTPL